MESGGSWGWLELTPKEVLQNFLGSATSCGGGSQTSWSPIKYSPDLTISSSAFTRSDTRRQIDIQLLVKMLYYVLNITVYYFVQFIIVIGLRRVSSLASSAFLASAASTRQLQDQILHRVSQVNDEIFDNCLLTRVDDGTQPIFSNSEFQPNELIHWKLT